MRSVIIKAVVTTLEILSDGVDTPYGYMMVCECKKCFTKYRFHGIVGDKFDFDNFAFTFMMRVKRGKKNNYGNI